AKDYIGRILGGYRLVALLGAGGAGAVFLGERLDDTSQQRAIKVLMPDDDLPATETSSFQARFLREAQAASQLHHAHILPILSFHSEASGLSYMELPLMSGGTLAGRIAAGPIPLDDVASYLRQIASALDYAHHQGVIHRDVKAVNVLLDQHGEAYLADFGIARIFERGARHLDAPDAVPLTPLTQKGQIIGTPACMAPEQFTGGAITPQLDIYALGVLAWQLVTGSLPFVASDSLQLALQHLNTPPPSARALRPELPEPADEALRKALAKQPQDRFDSAGTFASAFSDGLRGDWHPALNQSGAINHMLDTTLPGSAIEPGTSSTTATAAPDRINGAYPDTRTHIATHKLPENQSRYRPSRRTVAIALALFLIALGGVFAPRILPTIPVFTAHTATPSPPKNPSPTTRALQPLVPAGSLLYTTTAPGQCDAAGARWFTNVEGQQQCGGDETTLIGADCPCALALVKLQEIPGEAFPESYVIQARMQSIGSSRTDYFGFKFREQATTPGATNFGGYGFLVNANGEWQFNRYDPNGHRNIIKSGELPTPLVGPHVYDLTVNGDTLAFAVDGRTIVTERDGTYSGGIVDLAAEPRCVIFITAVALYSLP
ncbi:MAG TPA: serine/threonine-protein kinase, partial [Ktedonobacterales bacterium]|nr:serine/threonine-protein kinase [Ktedonobacterales bacterium]